MKNLSASLLAVSLSSSFACTSESVAPAPNLHSDEASLALAGAALAAELQGSPIHQSSQPFSRLGVMIDASQVDSVQIATSQDGRSWSAWKTVEARNTESQTAGMSLIGEVLLESPAQFFRLRGNAAVISFVRIDTLGDVDAQDASLEASDSSGPRQDTQSIAGPRYGASERRLEAGPGSAAFGNGYTFRTRKDWGATAVSCNTPMDAKKITIHHTDTPANNPESRVRQIQQYHRETQRWCDIGYHFLVDEQGVVYEGRKISTIGAHAYGANTDNVGIALIGSYETGQPTAAQLSSTAKLAADIAKEYGIKLSADTVKGHRQVGSTSTDCPGQHVFEKLSGIVAAANGQNPEPQPPPAPTPPVDPDKGPDTDSNAGCASGHSEPGGLLMLLGFVLLRRRSTTL
jgi:hypothetical protein